MMRRSDRELAREEAVRILEAGEYGVLSTVSAAGVPYGIPLNYAYQNGRIFMHCSREGGRKLDNLRANPRAAFSVVGSTELMPEKFGTKYLSALCTGWVSILESEEEKREGIEAILRKYSPQHLDAGMKYIDAAMDRIYILRFQIEEITGKGRKL